MIPSNLTYKKANSVDEALSMLKEYGDEARLLAGGHSLIPALKLRLNEYEYLIDISKIEELKSISEKDGHIIIGAGVTHGAIVDSALLKEKVSFFPEAADLIGDVQVRNMGTIGGSVAHADPAADWPALLLAADASVTIQNAGGSRDVKAEDFFLGLFQTALEDGEILTSIKIPIVDNVKSKYIKFMQPASRFAIVGCAVRISIDNGNCTDARVAYAGVSAKPFRDEQVENALVGKSFDRQAVDSAAVLAGDNVPIMSDHFASEEYRLQMTKVFTKRSLEAVL